MYGTSESGSVIALSLSMYFNNTSMVFCFFSPSYATNKSGYSFNLPFIYSLFSSLALPVRKLKT